MTHWPALRLSHTLICSESKWHSDLHWEQVTHWTALRASDALMCSKIKWHMHNDLLWAQRSSDTCTLTCCKSKWHIDLFWDQVTHLTCSVREWHTDLLWDQGTHFQLHTDFSWDQLIYLRSSETLACSEIKWNSWPSIRSSSMHCQTLQNTWFKWHIW